MNVFIEGGRFVVYQISHSAYILAEVVNLFHLFLKASETLSVYFALT